MTHHEYISNHELSTYTHTFMTYDVSQNILFTNAILFYSITVNADLELLNESLLHWYIRII